MLKVLIAEDELMIADLLEETLIMSGYDVCRTIRQQTWGNRMVLIALTGWGKNEDRLKSKEAGFDGHLIKPITPETVVQQVEAFIAAGRKASG